MISDMSDNIEAIFSYAWAKLGEIETITVARGKKGLPHRKVEYYQMPKFVGRIRPLKSLFQFIIALLLSFARRLNLICALCIAPRKHDHFRYLLLGIGCVIGCVIRFLEIGGFARIKKRLHLPKKSRCYEPWKSVSYNVCVLWKYRMGIISELTTIIDTRPTRIDAPKAANNGTTNSSRGEPK